MVFSLAALVMTTVALVCCCTVPLCIAFAISVFASALFLYLATLFGFLYGAKIVLLIFSVMFFAYALKRRRITLQDCTKFLPLMGILALVALVFHNAEIMGVDPSFWAEFSKYIHMTNSFWTHTSNIIPEVQHQTYFPGFALLASLFNGISPYKEEFQYYAFILPVITLLLLAAHLLSSLKETKLICIGCCILFFLLKTLGCINPVNFLNADYALAAFFTQCFLLVLFEKESKNVTLFLFFALPVLALTKITSIIIVFTVCVLYAARLYYEFNRNVKYIAKIFLLLFIPSLLFIVSWKINLSLSGIHDAKTVLSLEYLSKAIARYLSNDMNITKDLCTYIFLKPCILCFPRQIYPLFSTFAVFMYSLGIFLFLLGKHYRLYLAIFVCSIFSWLLLHLYIIPVALPDSYTANIIERTYPRYVGAYICAFFAVSVFGLFLRCKHVHFPKTMVQAIFLLCVLAVPAYAYCIHARSHPSLNMPVPHEKIAFPKLHDFLEVNEICHGILDSIPKHTSILVVLKKRASYQTEIYGHIEFKLCPFNRLHLREYDDGGISLPEILAGLKGTIDFVFLEDLSKFSTLPPAKKVKKFGNFALLDLRMQGDVGR